MKLDLKLMILGIVIILFGIYLRIIFIGYMNNSFIEFIWVISPIIGFTIALYGFLQK